MRTRLATAVLVLLSLTACSSDDNDDAKDSAAPVSSAANEAGSAASALASSLGAVASDAAAGALSSASAAVSSAAAAASSAGAEASSAVAGATSEAAESAEAAPDMGQAQATCEFLATIYPKLVAVGSPVGALAQLAVGYATFVEQQPGGKLPNAAELDEITKKECPAVRADVLKVLGAEQFAGTL